MDRFLYVHGIKNPSFCRKLILEYEKEGKRDIPSSINKLYTAARVGSDDINDYLKISKLLSEHGDPMQAHVIDKVLEIEPNNIDALTQKVDYYYRFCEYNWAISLSHKIIALSPNNISAISTLILSYLKINDWENCYKWSAQLVELSPTYSLPYYCLASSAFKLGYYEKGDSCFSKAVELFPNDVFRLKTSKHLCFRGIPISGSFDNMKNELEKLGYINISDSYSFQIDPDTDFYIGMFYDQNVQISVIRPNEYEEINRIEVLFDLPKDETTFQKLREDITTKYEQYGEPCSIEHTLPFGTFKEHGYYWEFPNGEITLVESPRQLTTNEDGTITTGDFKILLIYEDNYKKQIEDSNSYKKINDL